MNTKISTLRPGLLVSLQVSTRGNVESTKRVIEAEHRLDGGEEKARWETERVIADPDEHLRATQTRTKARYLISSVCAHSAFGLLCPETKAEEFDRAIAEARAMADEFNTGAQLTQVNVYVMTGRIAPDDVEAVKAINSEIRDLMETMAQGIERIDVKAIRDAASRAKEIGSMLSPDAEARVQIAVETARSAAKKLVQSGEQAAKEIDRSAIRKIDEMRTAFLDLDEGREIVAPDAEGRAVDLIPDPRAAIGLAPAKARAFEME